MTERNLRVKISIDTAALKADAGQASQALTGIGKAGTAAGSEISKSTKKIADDVEQSSSKVGSSFNKGFGQATSAAGIAANAGQAAGLAIVGAAGLAAAAVLKIGLGYERSMNSFQAVTGSSAAGMKLAGDEAKALGNDATIAGASAADAALSMTELAKGGLTASQAMSAARGTLQLAAAAQIDGAQAATIQSAALNTFGLSADKAGHVADVLANVANASSGEITDFASGMAQAGLVANSMGVSLDDTASVLGIFANQGLSGSDAGTSLKTMLVSLQSPSKQAAAALDELGVTAFDAQGNFVGMRTVTDELSAAQGRMTTQQFTAAASTAFGTDAVRAAVAMAGEGTAGFDSMSAAVGKAGGAQALAAAQTQGVTGAWAALTNTLETGAVNAFQALSPAIQTVIGALGGLVDIGSGVIGFVSGLPGPVLAGAAALTAIALVKSPVSSAFQSITEKISSFKDKVAEAASATPPLVDAVSPLADAMGDAGGGADTLAAGLEGAVTKVKESKGAVDDVTTAVEPLKGALEGAGASTDGLAASAGVVAGALAGAAVGADQAKDSTEGASEAAAPLGDALEGAGLSADSLGEGLQGAAEKAKESGTAAEHTGGKMAKLGAAAKLAGGGIVNAFGGPVVLAITALVGIISQVGSAMSDLNLETVDFSGAVDEVTHKISSAKIIDLIPNDTVKALQDAKVNLNDYADALAGNPDKQAAVTQALLAYTAGQAANNESFDKGLDLMKNFQGQIGSVASAEQSAADKATALAAAESAAGEAHRETAGGLNSVAVAAAASGQAADAANPAWLTYGEATGNAAGGVAKLGAAWADGTVDATEFSFQVASVMQKMDELAGRNGDAEAAQRALNGQIRDYADAQAAAVSGGAADRGVVQATLDQAAAQKDLNDAVKKYGGGSAEAQEATLKLADANDNLAGKQRDVGAAADAAAQKTADLNQTYVEAGTKAFNAAVEQGNYTGAVDAATVAMQGVKQSFIDAQPEADKVSGKAQEVADKLFGIPSEAATTIKANDEATSKIIDAQVMLAGFDALVAEAQLTVDDKASVTLDSVIGKLRGLDGRVVTTSVEVLTSSRAAGPSRDSTIAGGFTGGNVATLMESAPGRASGGPIRGAAAPLNPHKDNLLAFDNTGAPLKVRSDEWVVNGKVSAALGPDVMGNINAGAYSRDFFDAGQFKPSATTNIFNSSSNVSAAPAAAGPRSIGPVTIQINNQGPALSPEAVQRALKEIERLNV